MWRVIPIDRLHKPCIWTLNFYLGGVAQAAASRSCRSCGANVKGLDPSDSCCQVHAWMWLLWLKLILQGSKAELILTENVSELWSITAPVMFGRGLFIVAGYFTWAARNRSWSVHVKSSTHYFWWTTLLFTVGASLFYWGFYVVESPFEVLPGTIVQNWFGVLTGYITGSCLLFMASYIMMLELANKDRQPVEPVEVSLIMV